MMNFNLNPRKMESLMKQLGIKFEEMKDVEEVHLLTSSGKYIIKPSDVKIINAQGVKTLQVIIKEMNYEESYSVDEEDIKILSEKASISYEDAKKLLEKHKGNLAEALLEIENRD